MPRRSRVSADAFQPDWDLDEIFEEQEQVYQEVDFRKLGVDPTKPTNAKPGSPEKVLMLAARYAAGLPLWHEKDRYDHGPDEQDETGTQEAGVEEQD